MTTAPETPELVVLGDTYRFRWTALLLEAELTRFFEHRDSLVAELTIAVAGEQHGRSVRKLLHRSNLNLSAGETRGRLAKLLAERRDDLPWAVLLEQLCFLAVERYREGEPTVDLREVDPEDHPRWLLRPYLEQGGPTVLFAPGGSGKSYLSLAAAVTIASGVPVFGTPVAAPGAVLYLDWETDSWTFAARLRALCKGAGVAPVPPIYYRHMVGSLAEGLHAVHREVARLGVIAAFVDSLATARGGEPESAEVTNRLFTAMRSIDRPVFGVDHVSKAAMKDDPGSGGRLSPFGSVFTENRARNTWSVRRAGEEDGDEFDVALVHEKTNNGRYQKRHAYHLVFVNTSDAQGEERLDSVTIRPAELGRIAAFEATQTLPERILRYMRDSRDGTATPDEVAGALGIDRSKIAPRLSELRSTGKVVYLAGRQRYGLTTHRGDRGA